MDGIWLITSGAFVGQELAAEFGQLPPAFLPVGTRRLYEYQLDQIGPDGLIYLTLPEGFAIPADDLRRLETRQVSILYVPEGLSLGESVVFALNLVSGPDQVVRILHGDTLIDGLPTEGWDWIAVADGNDRYSWAEVEIDGDLVKGLTTVAAGVASERVQPVACGVFVFGHSAALIRSITRARGSFVAGIVEYTKVNPLRAVRVSAWHDFGHVQTYFRSRRVVASARHFNTLHIDGKTARKTSIDGDKIRAEATWFATVPPALRVYCARLIDVGEQADGQAFYETEYGYLPTLSELFVFGKVSRPVWMQILQCCRDFLDTCASITAGISSRDMIQDLAVAKTTARLEQFSEQSGFGITAALRYGDRPMPSLMQIAREIAGYIDLASDKPASVMHGDFCFSNILYDSRVARIHVIDPRGYVRPGEPTIFGDPRYDLAKLAHSVIGRYDQIIAGRYRLASADNGRFDLSFEPAAHHAWLEQALDGFEVAGVSAGGAEIKALTIALFLSMLPLHSDRPDRQLAFVANALRLYGRLETARG